MRIILFFMFFGLGAQFTWAQMEDAETFDKAYTEYWSKPVVGWDTISKTKKTETYNVQKKDTLSELSQVFFGSPNYWPKIWSLNSYIGNPHLIYPGNKIGFFMGSVDGPAPQVFLGGAPKIESKSSIYALDSVDVQLPPEPVDTPVLENYPRSFPIWQSAALDNGQNTSSGEVERQFSKLDSNIMTYDLRSFLHQGEIKSYGEIKGFLSVDFNVASSFDEVFIKSDDQLPVGEVFTLVMNRKNVKTPEGKQLLDVFIYEYVGEVKIIEDNKENNGLITGRITRALDMIDKGALLIPGKIPQYNLIYSVDEIRPFDAKLLRGSDNYGHNIVGVGQTVFVSKGQNDGLSSGMLLQIKQNREERNPEQELLNIVNQIGVVKIVTTTPNFSTGIVVSSRDFMLPGDKSIK
jgi:hypothetical protein